MITRTLLLLLLLLLSPPATGEEGKTIAVFPFKFMTPDRNPPDETERRRLAMLKEQLEQALVAAGYRIVDPKPVMGEIDIAEFSLRCLDCEIDYARELAADLATVGWVEKRNNVQLAMTLGLVEVSTGRTVREGSAVIRGNTDETWKRGLRFILKYQLLGGER